MHVLKAGTLHQGFIRKIHRTGLAHHRDRAGISALIDKMKAHCRRDRLSAAIHHFRLSMSRRIQENSDDYSRTERRYLGRANVCAFETRGSYRIVTAARRRCIRFRFAAYCCDRESRFVRKSGRLIRACLILYLQADGPLKIFVMGGSLGC
jgi:hypothetical protein